MTFKEWIEVINGIKYEDFLKLSYEEKEPYYIEYEFEYPTIIENFDENTEDVYNVGNEQSVL